MPQNSIQILGDREFNAILDALPARLHDKSLRDIARKGGRVILKAARQLNQIPGTVGKAFSREMLVASDKQNKAGVLVTVRGGRQSRVYTNSQGEKIIAGAVGRHMTEGANQHVRVTKTGKNRGKVSKRYPDPILAAADAKGNEAMDVMQKEAKGIIEKTIDQYARK